MGRPPFQNYIVAFWKWFGTAAFWKWVDRLFKIGRPPFQNGSFGRLLKMIRPPFENGSTVFWKLYGRLLKIGRPPFHNGSLKMDQPPFQNGLAPFWRWVDRLLKIIWSPFENGSFGRLLKMVRWKCRPPFENYTVAFWKWFGRLLKMGQPPFENGSLKMSTTEDSLAAQSVGFWRYLCLQIRPSFVNRRLLNIVEPTKTANEATQAAKGEVNWAANLSIGKCKENTKTFMS